MVLLCFPRKALVDDAGDQTFHAHNLKMCDVGEQSKLLIKRTQADRVKLQHVDICFALLGVCVELLLFWVKNIFERFEHTSK